MAGKLKRKNNKNTADEPVSLQATAKIDHMMVSSGSVKHGRPWPGPTGNRKTLLLVVALLVVAGSYMLYRGWKAGQKPVVAALTCSDTIINKGASSVEASQVERLEPVANQIKQIPNLDDPDCLYLLTIYYVNMSDPDNAAASFKKLQKAYDPKVGYDRALESVARTPKDLKRTVVFLQNHIPKKIGPDGAPL